MIETIAINSGAGILLQRGQLGNNHLALFPYDHQNEGRSAKKAVEVSELESLYYDRILVVVVKSPSLTMSAVSSRF